MLKIVIFCYLCILVCLESSAQAKPSIDTSTFDKWPSASEAVLSNDGKFAMYTILTGGETKNFIKSTCGSWSMETSGSQIYTAKFSFNSLFAFFLKKNDSLVIIDLIKRKVSFIGNVVDFKVPDCLSSDWAGYLLQGNILLLQNLKTKKIIRVSNVLQFYFYDNARSVIIQQKLEGDATQLIDLSLKSQLSKIIWHGLSIVEMNCEPCTNDLTFIEQSQSQHVQNKSIWYYDSKKTSCKKIITSNNLSFPLTIGNLLPKLAGDTSSIYFWAIEEVLKMDEQVQQGPIVYHYQDVRTFQSKDIAQQLQVLVKYSFATQQILYLTKSSEDIVSEWSTSKTHALVKINTSCKNVDSINQISGNLLLVNLSSGVHTSLNINWGYLSPDNKFVVYFDTSQMQYCSYDIVNHNYHTITKGVYTNWTSLYEKDKPRNYKSPRGIAGWDISGKSVLIYDRYDIWQVDLMGINRPTNITAFFGRNNQTIFSIAVKETDGNYSINNDLILSAFNNENKENGFYKVSLEQGKTPERLFMGSYLFHVPDNPYLAEMPLRGIVKAKFSKTYLLMRMSSKESPNYVATNDFKIFKPISDIRPELNYNWLSAELIHWSNYGTGNRGILFKPQNFDSSKQYPVIVYIYEKFSDALNGYYRPGWSKGGINIPWLVSNGYLVFAPDIEYEIGLPMQSALNCVVSGITYLKRKVYVDSSNLGLHGMSFGALEVNYILTQTNIFKAACSASGVVDLVSFYGAINTSGISNQDRVENGQLRMGVSLWQDPSRYISNSPIFGIDKISTPLLLMHTTNDDNAPFVQAIEFFLGLKSMGKKVWLIAYSSEGNHAVWGNSAKDYSIRLKQYFDYYLKGATMPEWMIYYPCFTNNKSHN